MKYLGKASAVEDWKISAEAGRIKLASFLSVEMRAQVTHEGDESISIIRKWKALNISLDRSGAVVSLGVSD